MQLDEKLPKLITALLVVAIATLAFVPVASAGTYKSLYKFTGGADGEFPAANLIFDQAGNIYGTTAYGGANNSGTVFKLTLRASGNWTESVLYNFCPLANCPDGQAPYSTLNFDQQGNLYGTTVLGGSAGRGTAFELAHNLDGSWTESVLYNFCSLANCVDGAHPLACSTISAPSQTASMGRIRIPTWSSTMPEVSMA